jgi:hypothetical protein
VVERVYREGREVVVVAENRSCSRRRATSWNSPGATRMSSSKRKTCVNAATALGVSTRFQKSDLKPATA